MDQFTILVLIQLALGMKELKQVNSRIRQFEERLQQEILSSSSNSNTYMVQQFRESLEFLHQRRRELKDLKRKRRDGSGPNHEPLT